MKQDMSFRVLAAGELTASTLGRISTRERLNAESGTCVLVQELSVSLLCGIKNQNEAFILVKICFNPFPRDPMEHSQALCQGSLLAPVTTPGDGVASLLSSEFYSHSQQLGHE